MADVTVKNLAQSLNKPVEQLLEQFVAAGVELKSFDDIVSDEEKMLLVQYLRKDRSENLDRVKLKRKSVSQLKATSRSTSKVVNVEVRKKRAYIKKKVKPEVPDKEEASTESAAKPEIEVPDVAPQDTPPTAELVPSVEVKEESAEIQSRAQDEERTLEIQDSIDSQAPPAQENKRGKVTKRKELHVKSEKRGKRNSKKECLPQEKLLPPISMSSKSRRYQLNVKSKFLKI